MRINPKNQETTAITEPQKHTPTPTTEANNKAIPCKRKIPAYLHYTGYTPINPTTSPNSPNQYFQR